MASEISNGKRVAIEVKKMVRNGVKINKQIAQKKVGYTDKSAKAFKGTNNLGYIEEMEGFVNKLEKEANRIQKAIENKDLSAEEYRDLVKALDTYIKNIQLLGGKPTGIIKSDDYKDLTTAELERRLREIRGREDKEGAGEEES